MSTSIAVPRALASVADPLLGQPITDLGFVHAVRTHTGGRVTVELILPDPAWPAAAALMTAVEQAVLAVPAVRSVTVRCLPEPLWTPQRLTTALAAPLTLAPPPAPRRWLHRLLGRA